MKKSLRLSTLALALLAGTASASRMESYSPWEETSWHGAFHATHHRQANPFWADWRWYSHDGDRHYDFLRCDVQVPLPASAVPEPSTMLLLGLGAAGLGLARRRFGAAKA